MEKIIAEIDLMSNKKMYVVRDGQLIEHELPKYGETGCRYNGRQVGSSGDEYKKKNLINSLTDYVQEEERG
jgi:hypothetical protein